ncbi:hypothetical protein LGQ03_07115 [Loktanella sp. TSTF-M6]|uniref:Antibiotic biosynthesis monooxygenase n=1 Tax=Loktanella gaetbuli TaxID=2881335 RepID=A0ABS8BTE9_9RHOB|nr:hypothetical protein [Loktanella gaetbuli]MCB5199005.1 hypothetical protein [Loktanella gaetbuli]
MSRRTPNARARAALTHAVIIKIAVPSDGLGQQIHEWTVWLNEHAPGWASCEVQSLGRDVAGFAFRDPQHAVDFLSAHPAAELANA